MFAVDSRTSRMSAGMVPAPGNERKTLRSSTLLTASAVVAGSSALGGKVAGDGGGDDLVVGTGNKGSKLFRVYEKGAEYFTNLFPVWLTMFSLVALKDPTMFAWFTTE